MLGLVTSLLTIATIVLFVKVVQLLVYWALSVIVATIAPGPIPLVKLGTNCCKTGSIVNF